MRSIALAILCLSVPAAADSDLRIGVGAAMTSQRDSLESAPSTTPGPSLSLDLMPRRQGLVLGAHLGWSSSFNTYPSAVTVEPVERHSFDQLFEAHAQLEWHRGPVAIGAGLGIDVVYSRGTYTVMSYGNPTHRDMGLGARLSASVDVARLSRGTLAVTGSASLFSLVHATGICGGELSCADQATSVNLGIAFRPRRGSVR